MEDDLILYPLGFKDSMKSIFEKYDVIIGIMAMGIIVRDITPLMKHKSIDPAVLCLSVDGKYIIPVLSGHLGGANEVATLISTKLYITPVITTASDLLNKKAVDIIAKERGLTIASYKDAMDITASMINNENIVILEDNDVKDFNFKGVDGVVYVGNKMNPGFNIPFAKLIPKNIVIGIGARRNTEYQSIMDFLNSELKSCNLDIRSIKFISSIDIKKDEEGIIKLSEQLKVPFITYSAKEISEVEHMFNSSDFVKKITGVGSVSMPSGYIASNKGSCLLKRVADRGITLSIWKENT